MTPTQFSLFFAALAIGYILVHVRLVRFEKYLREIVGIKALNERLQGVSDVLERVRLDRVEEQLQQLHEDLESLETVSKRIERVLSRTGGGSATAAGSARQPGERIRSLVETRLLDLGYKDLRLLTDLTKATLEEQLEVLVECERDHMPCKGRVTTRNGSIVEVHITAASQAFP